MTSQVALIRALVKSLVESGATSSTGEAALTPFLKTLGIDNYKSFEHKFRSAQSGYSNQDFLEQVCGVRRNNADTGAITGSDAGGSITKTAESIIPESSTAKELSSSEYYSFTKNGLTVNITYDELSSVGSKYNYEVSNYIAKQKLVVKKLYNWWIPESLDLINQSLGINFSDGRANCTTLNINFSSNTIPILTDVKNDMGYASTMTMTIGMGYLSELTENDKNGTLSSKVTADYLSTNYLDRILLNNLADLTLAANIPYFYNLPGAIKYCLAFVVGGYDDSNYGNSEYCYSSYYKRPDGYTMLRWLAKNYADQFEDTDSGSNDTGLMYNNSKTAVTITSNYSDTELDNDDYDSTVVTINGSGRSTGLEIEGNDRANVIVGTKGADTIDGGKGNDTLTGGNGNDVFKYDAGEGDDVITDYTQGQDKILIDDGIVSSGKVSGNDVILTIGRNNLTLKNAVGKTLSIEDDNGEFSTVYSASSSGESTVDNSDNGLKYNTAKTAVTITSGYSDKEIDDDDYDSKVVTINGSIRSTGLEIEGNDKANVIVGTKGADTIDGGKGNDTLTGGNGNDVFKYDAGEGDDVITDYTQGQDKILIDDGIVSSGKVSGNDVILTIGRNNLTLKNAVGKILSIEDDNGEFSTVYSASSSGESTVDNSDNGLKYNTAKTAVTITSGYSDKEIDDDDYDSKVVTINGSIRSTGLDIEGNDKANVIVGTKGTDTIDGGKGNDTLTGGKGNDVFKYDSGEGNDVITDYTENEDKIIIDDGIISNSSLKGNDVVLTIGNNTLTVKNGKDKAINVTDNNGEYEVNLTNTVDEDTIDGGNGIIYNQSKTAATITSNYTSTYLWDSEYESSVNTINASQLTSDIYIWGNDNSNCIIGGKGNDTLTGSVYGDDTLTGGAGNDVFVYWNNNDVITDYTSGEDKIKIYSSYYITSASLNDSDVLFNGGYGDNFLTVKNAAGKEITIVDSNDSIIMTTVIGTAVDDTPKDLIYNNAKTAVTITSDYSDTELDDDYYDLTVVTITGASRSTGLEIEGNGKANVIVGTKGADTIDGGKGNDTLTGGSGKDIFVYGNGDGNDVITDYVADQDKILIEDEELGNVKSSIKGSDTVIKVGTGSITVKNGKGKKLTIEDIAGNSITTIVSGGASSNSSLPSGISYANNNKTMNVKSPFTGTLDVSKYASTVKNVDASTNTKFISVKGTSRAETIKAGKKGSLIVGGKGNDTLYGGKGADTFSYANGDGKDVIANFSSDYDMIKITSGTISKASVSGSNVVLKVGSGSITINNAKGKDINITDQNGEIATYNFTGTVNNPTTSRNYEERWFLDNEELKMQNAELDLIDSILNSNSKLISNECNYDETFDKNSSIINLSSALVQSKRSNNYNQ